MLRFDGTPSRQNSSAVDFLEGLEQDKESHSPLNQSLNSVLSGASSLHTTASSSKAVLAALRALQDKIRRLEVERAHALDEAAQLRTQLKNYEIESEHAKQREVLNAQRSLHEAKNNYERLLEEKSELERKLRHFEERNREHISLSEEYEAKIRVLEETKMSGISRLKELEFRSSELEADLRRAQQREKDLTNAMMWENKRHEDETRNLRLALEKISDEVSQKSLERVEKETKLMELEHLVSQLLAINESLVSELGGKKATKVTLKKKKKVKSDVTLIPRVATLSTASTDAKFRKKPSNLEHLKSVHEMYSNIAKSITGVTTKTVKKTSAKKATKETSMKKRLTKVKNLSNKLSSASVPDSNVYKLKVNIPSVSSSIDKFDAKFGDLVTEEQLTQEKDEMQGVIHSLEEEFDELNEQYRRLLSSKDASDGGASEELVSVIQKMHKKGEQLRALKSPTRNN